MSSPRSQRRISEIVNGGKIFGPMLSGASHHLVAMVPQILVKCTPFETFIFLWHTTNV